MQVNYNALDLLATKKANQINLKKDYQDYFYSVGKYQFIISKQPKCGNMKGGYFVECKEWINNNMHQKDVDFSQDIMNLKEVKKSIFLFLFAQSVNQALININN